EVLDVPTIELASVDPTCDVTTGTITVTNASADNTYSIDGTTFAPCPASGWSGLAPGAYTVTVRTADGCEASADITIAEVLDVPTIELDSVDPTYDVTTGTITVTNASADNTYSIDGTTFAP